MLILFSLVLARVIGLLMGAPVFSSRSLPRRFRIGLAVLITFTLLPALADRPLPEHSYAVAGAMAAEGLLGFSMGLLVRMFISIFELAGGIIGFQAGFGLTNVFDPVSDSQASVLQTLHVSLATVFFLAVDGHHMLLRGLAASFEFIPVASLDSTSAITSGLFDQASALFEGGARVAGPVTGFMLLLNGVVGFLNRVMPQLSIFNIGFPMTVFGGLCAVFLSIPELGSSFLRAFGELEGRMALMFGG